MEINRKRNYGIDLLRIVSMLMIVLLHILGQGVITHTEPFGLRYEVSWFIEICSLCAVNCYAIITGYVSINSKKYRYSDLATLWLRILFYSVIITIIGYYAIPASQTVKQDIFYSFFPVFTGKYWYVTAYVALYLLMPFFKKAINSMTRRQFRSMLITGGIIFALMPSLFRNDVFYVNLGYSFLWISYMFCVGAYIKKYIELENIKFWKMIVGYFACVFGTLAFKYLYELYYSDKAGEYVRSLVSENYNFPFILFSAIFLFLAFAKIKVSPTPAKVIAFISPIAFSVYLIHVHPVIWNAYISWHFVSLSQSSTPIMVLKIFGYAIAIFAICVIIDIPREYIFKWLGVKEKLRKFEEKRFKSLW